MSVGNQKRAAWKQRGNGGNWGGGGGGNWGGGDAGKGGGGDGGWQPTPPAGPPPMHLLVPAAPAEMSVPQLQATIQCKCMHIACTHM